MSATGYLSVRSQYSGPAVANTAGTLVDAFDSSLTSFVYGTSPVGAIDTVWSHSNAAVDTTGDTHTLTALTGPSGSVSFAHLRELTIWGGTFANGVFTPNAIALTVGGAATHAFTGLFSGTVVVPAGGCVTFVSPLSTGIAVGSGATDQLKIVAASSTSAYTVIAKGTVA